MSETARTPRVTQAGLMAAVSVMQIVITIIVAPLATWSLARIVDYGERISRIESTRFTAEDARKMFDVLDARLRGIERSTDKIVTTLGIRDVETK